MWIDIVVGIESRGFIIGGARIYARKGFVPVRKAASSRQKRSVMNMSLSTTDKIEMHTDAIIEGMKVLRR